MFKALIVDDEQPVLDGLRVLINRHLETIQVAGTARSGREALELARSLMPDLVLMDVNMPGMTGLETIREMRRFLPDAIYLLVTAYERFDIAQEAFDLGVQDYLLKPVNRDRLLAVLGKTVRTLEERMDEREQSASSREILEDARLLLEPQLFRTARLRLRLTEAGYHSRLQTVCRILQVKADGGRVVAVGGNGLGSRAQDFREKMRYKSPCVVAADGPDRVQVFIPRPDSRDGERVAVLIKSVADEVLGGEEAFIGMGSDVSLWDLSLSLEESHNALMQSHEEPDATWPWQLEKDVVEALVARDSRTFMSELGRLVDVLLARGGNAQAVQVLANQLEELGAVLVHMLCQQEPKAGLSMERPRLDASSSPSGLRDNFLAWAIMLLGVWEEFEPRKLSPVVQKAQEFMEANFSRAISLDDAAHHAGVSSQYLSRVFSEETGESFIDVLTRLRMQRARELLKEGVPIKVVSQDLGYSDPNYFGRLFKRLTGLTPKEYARG